ncbi:hypothetical protein [Streptomyces sp. NRRL S-337]|uniref:hypothetical protein n=1 Tax=Streptomyces sp. NRRL S-337 TaxID=1463900 RepID=UPI0004CC279F|nr:hypothetical protein [Streptomyces sp. NRRL S-337]
MSRPAEWFRIYDSSPVADVDITATYRKETSDDDGRTWEYPRPSTGEHLRLDMSDALYAGCSVDVRDGVIILQSPHPMGGLVRYTLAH